MICYLTSPTKLTHYAYFGAQNASLHAVVSVAKLWTFLSSHHNDFNEHHELENRHHRLTSRSSSAETTYHNAAAPNGSIRYEGLDNGPAPNGVLNCWISVYGYVTHRGTASVIITSEECSFASKVWSLDIGILAHCDTTSSTYSLHQDNGTDYIRNECSYTSKGHVSPCRPLPSILLIGRSLFVSSQRQIMMMVVIVMIMVKNMGVHVRSRRARVYHRLFFHLLHAL